VKGVGEINDTAIISALRRQLTIASARQTVAAGNLANVNTPGFRAREVKFDEVLDAELSASGRLMSTNAHHMAGAVAVEPGVVDADSAARRDGNTVQLDRELLTMSRAAGDFAAAQTALAAKFRLVRYAINESR
jgi:flagellar basal-body rod protein FlgB